MDRRDFIKTVGGVTLLGVGFMPDEKLPTPQQARMPKKLLVLKGFTVEEMKKLNESFSKFMASDLQVLTVNIPRDSDKSIEWIPLIE